LHRYIEVLALRARNQVVRRGKGVLNEKTPQRVSRSVDLGARRVADSQHPGDGLTVEGSSMDHNELVRGLLDGGRAVSHEQHVERRSVIRGMLPPSQSSGYRAAETEVTADMKVLDGEYQFTTSLEAWIHDDDEGGGGVATRRSVFSQRWTQVVPAPP
jgi:hypothetical protein